MKRESREAHSELVDWATDGMGLIQRAQWTREKGAILNSPLCLESISFKS